MKEYRMTIPQKGMYDLESFGGEIVTTIGGDFFLKGKLNEEVMNEAINMVVKHNVAYRLRFINKGDEVVQYVADYSPAKFCKISFHTLDEYLEWIKDYQKMPIKENDGLYEFIIVELDDAYGVIERANHKINDDWGMFLCKKRIVEYYRCLLDNKPIEENPYSYLDFIEEEDKYFASKYYAKDKEYWNNLIQTYSEPTKLVEATANQLTINRKIYPAGDELQELVEKYCKEKSVSEFSLLLAAFSFYINQRTRRDDSYILTTFASRTSKSDKASLGMYVNSVPIHIVQDKSYSIHDYIKSVVVSVMDAIRYRRYGYDTVLKDAYSQNITEQLSDVFFSLLNSETYKEQDELLCETFHSGVQVESLNLIARINPDRKLEFNYYYHIDSFKEWEIDTINQNYCYILRTMIEHDEIPISDLSPFDPVKYQELLSVYNATDRSYPSEATIGQLVEEKVEKNPDCVAVVFGDEKLTYRELNEKANALARKIREQDIKPDSLVALISTRSIEIFIGILAIIKSGAAYVPIDPIFPQDRIDYILEDCKPNVVLTYGIDNAYLKDSYYVLELENQELYDGNRENLSQLNTKEHLAYVLYTSGTTGKPKGVMIQHSSLVNYCCCNDRNIMYEAVQSGCRKIACVTNICFDICVTETWMALINGMTVSIANSDEQEDSEKFDKFIKQNEIEILQTTPSRMKLLSTGTHNLEGLRRLKYIYIGGEQVQESLVSALKEQTDATIVNVYGPTETTVWSSFTNITDEDLENGITIGQPVSNTQIYIVADGKLCGVGWQGEVCIAGNGLARGYFNKPELTNEKFVDNPFGEGKMYKTGDLGRMMPNGTIDFIGRKDTQVKIRGFRIELGEIENVIRAIDGVDEAIVTARKNITGYMELNAYLVAADKIDMKSVQNILRQKLPEYMVPAYMMQIDQIPITRNGKLNVAMLPTIVMDTDMEYVEPRNNIEKDIAQIFCEVLGVEEISINSSFFEMGGDSIKATLIVSKAKVKGYAIKAREVMVRKTVENLAQYIEKNGFEQKKQVKQVVVNKSSSDSEYEKIYPLTPVQEGILYQYQLEQSTGEYFMQSVIHSFVNINPFFFIQAIQLLTQKHEVLRTKILFGDDVEPCQAISKNIEVECTMKNVDSEEQLLKMAAEEVERGFDLTKDSLMRVTLVSMNNENKYLIWSIHHIISDGWSNSIYFRDFNQLYQMLASGTSYNELKSQIQAEKENTSCFSDYVSFLCNFDNRKSLEYWMDMLEDYEGNSEILSISDSHSEENTCKMASKVVDIELKERLEKLAKQLGVTLNMIFETALGVLLQRYTGIDDVVFGKVISGRNAEILDIEEIAGIFINMIPVRVQLQEDETVKQLVESVSEQSYSSMQHGYCSLADIQSYTSQNRDLIKVLFAYENFYGSEEFAQRSDYEFVHNREQTNYDLTTTIKLTDVTTIELMYNTQKYCEEDGELFVERYYNILKEFTDDPDRKCKKIVLAITEMEKNRVFDDYNKTEHEFPEGTLHGLFIKQAERTPDNVAVICDDETITYAKLYKKSCQVANYIQSLGIEANSNIAISGEKRIETVINMLGILLANCRYVPLNPEYPRERNEYIITSSNSKLELSADSYATLSMNRFQETVEADEVDPQSIAYTIYTSGSTGRPKGVVINHSGAVNTILDINEKFNITSEDCIIGLSAFSFDLSVYDVFGALSTGARLVIVKDQRDVSEIANIVKKHKVTFWNSVPAIMSMFLENVDSDFKSNDLKNVLFSGDWIPLNLPSEVTKRFENAKVTSLGGATEGSIWSIYYPIEQVNPVWRSIPYGRPLANQQMYVMDSELRICPLGINGQICIGGKGVAVEYANDPEKTSKAFISHSEYGKIYLTGDMGRMRLDGNIEFLGRMDDQVKIRGFRIELGEIENVIQKVDGVTDAAVVAREMQEGNKELVAYIVASKKMNASRIQQEIRKKLPEYMVPNYMMQIDAIPLSSNGKLDKKALPAPAFMEKEYVPPRNSMESVIVKAFEEVLQRPSVSVKDSFFDIGGHSLKATKLSNEIQKKTGVKLLLRDIFNASTPELLATKVKNASEGEYAEIGVVEPSEYYEMSSAQRRLFLLEQMSEADTNYNISGVLKIAGELDVERLQTAINQLIAREEVLRTSFHMIDGKTVQKVEETAEIKVDYQQQEQVDIQEILNDFVKPFDLGKAPLMRVKVVKSADEYLMFWDIHHIISDGESVLLMVDEISELYNGRKLTNHKIQYKDYSAWQNSRNIDDQRDYWKQEFSGSIPVLDLQTDFVRPQEQSYRGAVLKQKLNPDIKEKVLAMCKKTKSTEYMVMLSAFMLMLNKYSRQDEIIVGMPISGRTHADTHAMLGMFVNTLALRVEVNAEDSYQTFLESVKTKCLEAYDNQEYQFDDLVELVDVQRDMSRNPIFDVMFVMQNNEEIKMNLGGAEATFVETDSDISKFDITLSVEEGADGYTINFEYCTDLFKPETIELMLSHYATLMEQILAHPDAKLNELSMVNDKERDAILQEFNNTAIEYDKSKTVVDLFEEQVAKVPDNVALTYEGNQLTYQEFNRKVNQLAHLLREEYDVKPDDFVALLTDRSLEMLISIFAVIKAGGAYLPIDPTNPQERKQYILEDSNPKVILTYQKEIDSDIPTLDLENPAIWTKDDSDLEHVNKPSDLLYMIYTSGTTGNPKGVMIEHRGINNIKNQFHSGIRITEPTTVGMFHNYIFDGSVCDIMMALLTGSKLVILSESQIYDMNELKDVIEKEQIQIITLPPTYVIQTDFKGVKTLMTGGSEAYTELLDHVEDTYINAYGPTENTIDAVFWRYQKGEPKPTKVPIGKPLPNVQIYIANGKELCGIGVPGELCIAGDSLARGYYNRPELTQEKFVDNIFGEGKMYRSGDLARWLPDGNIEYLGRIDQQVKIRGFRIELGEIESKLLSISSIKECVVIARDNQNKEKYLCAYIVSDQEEDLDEVKDSLRRSLPESMIPSYIMQIPSIPVKSNGKVDVKALPEPELTNYTEYIAPRNAKEEAVVNAFAFIFGMKQISITDNFFDLGGDSIKAIRLVASLRESGYGTNVKEIMSGKTPENIAKDITEQVIKANQEEVVGQVPLSAIQREFFEEDNVNPEHYNQSILLECRENIDLSALELALEKVTEHHDILRATFENGEQLIGKPAERKWYELTVCECSKEDISLLSEEIQKSIRIENGPLTKVGVFKTAEKDYLLLVIHHLIVDGVSWRILAEDLANSYAQAKKQETIVLPEKTMSYKDWVNEVSTYAESYKLHKEVLYWNEINQKIESCKFKENVEEKEPNIVTSSIALNQEDTKSLLRNCNKAYLTEINDLLITSLSRAIHKTTGQSNISFELEGHGREQISENVNILRTVGWFTSIYPVVLKNIGQDLGRDIRNVKETLRRIPNKGIGYGILKYMSSNKIKEAERPNVTFNYLGESGAEQNESGSVFTLSSASNANLIDPANLYGTTVNMNGIVENDSLHIEVMYDESQYSKDAMEDFLHALEEELIEVISHCTTKEKTTYTASDFGELAWSEEEFFATKAKFDAEGKEIERIYPLTPMQEGMLYEKLLDENSMSYVIQQVIRLDYVNPDHMKQALEALVAKHDILHTVIKHKGVSVARQVLLKERKPEFVYLEAENEEQYEQIKNDDIARGFDLEEDALLRMSIVKVAEDDYRMLLTSHHIVSDGWSVSIMYGDLVKFYNTLESGEQIEPENGGRFEDFVQHIAEKDKAESISYWTELLTDYQEDVDILPMGTVDKAEEKENVKVELSEENAQKALKICSELGVTINTLLEAVWGILLQKYNRTEDVVFGKVVSGRNVKVDRIEDMIGLFINTIPVRVKTEKNETFKELVIDLQKQGLSSDEHSYCSLADIQSTSCMGNKLINTLMAFENYYMKDIEELKGNGTTAKAEFISSTEGTSYGLCLTAFMTETLQFHFQYDETRYSRVEIEIILGHVKNLLEAVIDNPDSVISEIVMTDEQEIQTLLQYNPEVRSYPREKTIVALFEEQAKRTPDRIAIKYKDQALTYEELNRKANCVANLLRSKYGIKPNDFVAVITERSLEMLIGIFGVIKSGGAYVPIDPKYPSDRITYILDDSKPKATLLYHSDLELDCPIIDLENDDIWANNQENPEPVNAPEDILYVIYTSGTTGRPKGVMVKHENLVSLLKTEGFQYDFNEADVWTLFHSHCFDFSVWEIFCSLLYGGKLIVVPREVAGDTFAFSKLIEEEQVTVLNQVPSSFYNLITVMDNKAIPSLRYVIFGGEALNPRKLREWHENNRKCSIVNMYGITETTVHVTYKAIEDEEIAIGMSNIGTAIPTLSVYVMNGYELCGIGVPGELCVTGAGVTKGYLNREELTAEKFVMNPYNGERMYRSGDLARWLSDGTLEYLGRIDEQVKIRGFRIELGEIESAIRNVKDVKDAVVITRKMKGGDNVLNAYIVSDTTIDAKTVQNEIRKMLPEYMVPGYIMQIDKLPVTSNGKLNRKLLPEIEQISTDTYVAPRTEMEKQIESVFQEVLAISNVGIHNNFFEIGGHSLKAIFVVNKIAIVTGVQITLKDFFDNPTVASISALIEQKKNIKQEGIEKAEKKGFYPMLSTQERMFIIQDLDTNGTTYNIPVMLDVEGILDREQLQNAFQKLADRHEALRTSFCLKEGKTYQKVQDKVEVDVEFVKFDQKVSEMDQSVVQQFVRPFDLAVAPLMRVKVIETFDNHSLLLFDVHHIITDGVSQNILIEDLEKLYNGESLPEVKVQYKDYSEWMRSRDLSDQKEYWLEQFADEISAIDIPLDYARPKIQNFVGGTLKTCISKELVEKVKDLAARTKTTEYMILLSAFSIMLTKYSGQEDLVIGTPVSGRTHFDTEQIVGMFVNTLALRCRPANTKTFTKLLEEVKETCLKGFSNQDYPFEELVEELELERDTSRNPLFDVMFTMNKDTLTELQFGGLETKIVPIEEDIAKFDITVQINERNDEYDLQFEYSKDLFKEETIQLMIDNYVLILESIVKDDTTLVSSLTATQTEKEQQCILGQFNDTDTVYPSDKTIIELFNQLVISYPDKIAVTYENAALTYSQLNDKANALAHKLVELGVQLNDFVALFAERSIEVIIGILAIVKVGAAYVPIDPQYPKERIDYALQDCAPKAVLVYQVEVNTDCTIIDLADESIYEGSFENPVCEQTINDLVYVIYTSGTTGQPKGVMVDHKNIIRLIKNTNYIDLTPDTVILQTGAISFDASTFEIWGALLNGGQVCLAHKYTLQSPKDMMLLIREKGINTVFITTALFNQMIHYDSSIFSPLRYLMFGGEKTSEEYVKAFMDNPLNENVIFSNVYGPTEATTFSLYFRIEKNYPAKTPIGIPISNGKAYILDSACNLCSIGQKGELCLTGDGIAHGYLNKPELTAEKFIDNPFGEGKLYRTGDLARWLPDGNIEFLGRLDDQVKIRGFRIEIGDIESVIRSIDSVEDIVVIVQDNESGTKELCAYIVANEEIDPVMVQNEIRKHLPEYMVPKRMMQLDKIPVNRNGKVDKRKLPKITMASTRKYVMPETENEKLVCDIFAKVLAVSEVGLLDNLFELGGDSIKAIRIVSRLRDYGFEVSMKELLCFQNVQSLAAFLSKSDATLTYSQEEICGEISDTPAIGEFKNFKLNAPQHFHQNILLESKSVINEEALRKALQMVVEHHDMLRAVYKEDKLVVRNSQEGSMFELVVEELTNISEIADYCTNLQASTSIQSGPMLKAAIITVEEKQYLFIAIHHLVVDTISWRILLEDLLQAYTSILNGQEVVLPQKTISFMEWADYLQEYLDSADLSKERKYWRNVSDEALEINLPLEIKNGEKGGKITFTMNSEKTMNLLYQTRKTFNTEVRDILLAALAMTIKEWKDTGKAVVMLEGHGREELHKPVINDRTVGWFTSIYPTIIEACETDADTIISTKENIRGIPHTGIDYGILKYLGKEELEVHSDITWNYHGLADVNDEEVTIMKPVQDIDTGYAVSESNQYLTPIIMELMVIHDQLVVDFIYQEGYAKDDIARFAEIYEQKIELCIDCCMNDTQEHRTLSDFGFVGEDEIDLDEINQLAEDLF